MLFSPKYIHMIEHFDIWIFVPQAVNLVQSFLRGTLQSVFSHILMLKNTKKNSLSVEQKINLTHT